MPWEKNFDLDEATDKAIGVFSKKGYDGTSMADLTEAMEINKGSLYNAFGSKKKLFDRALLRYDQLKHRRMLNELDKIEDPVAAVATLFDALVEEAASDTGTLGCLLVNTALDLPNRDTDVRNLVSTSLLEIEAFFRRTIERGQQQGSIPGSIHSEQAAKSLLALVLGLRVLARGACKPSALSALKSEAVRLIS